MLNKLKITFLAGALALVGLPAFAFDLPDSGSKNFSPSGDTPSYFNNETAPLSARTADTTERDWSAVDALAPERQAVEPAPAAQQSSGRHGKYASAQRSAKHSFGKTSANRQSTHLTTASAHSSAAQTRTAARGRSGP